MECGAVAVMRNSLRLGPGRVIEKMLSGNPSQRIDTDISHSGCTLITPETGERGTLYWQL